MSLIPRLTLIGLYNYNPSVFANLMLPASVDEETFINSLMLEYGECPLIYPDYDFMKLAIGVWCRKWYDNIERIASALSEQYNPLHNYDRTETWTEHEEGNKDFTRDLSNEESTNINETVTDETETTEDTTDENLVSAYNEDGYQPSNKNIIDKENSLNRTSTKTAENERDNSVNENYAETNGKQNTRSGRAFGNIGVTENTTMLQHELDLRKTENLYHIISEMFYKEFCIYVF